MYREQQITYVSIRCSLQSSIITILLVGISTSEWRIIIPCMQDHCVLHGLCRCLYIEVKITCSLSYLNVNSAKTIYNCSITLIGEAQLTVIILDSDCCQLCIRVHFHDVRRHGTQNCSEHLILSLCNCIINDPNLK